MRTHKDDFMPFLTNDQGDMMSGGERGRLFIVCEDVATSPPRRPLNLLNAFQIFLLSAEFEAYLVKMEKTAEWGGEHEVLLWCRKIDKRGWGVCLRCFLYIPLTSILLLCQIVALSKALGRPIQTFQAFMPSRTINEELSGPVVRLS
jgi:hypothetical protein